MAIHEVQPEASNVRQRPLRRVQLGLLVGLLVAPLLILGINRLRY
jgi:hypothetical protein